MDISTQSCYYLFNYCATLSEWKDWFGIIGTIAATLIGAIGLVKLFYEISRMHSQKEREAKEIERAERLKRTEFFLGQHRRLFDTPDLFEILCLIDSPHAEKLREQEMWDKKRKFLTFFEEMALLVNNDLLDPHVADYMFAYYAKTAWSNEHFREGIDPSPEHWGLLFAYIESSNSRRSSSNHPTPTALRL